MYVRGLGGDGLGRVYVVESDGRNLRTGGPRGLGSNWDRARADSLSIHQLGSRSVGWVGGPLWLAKDLVRRYVKGAG